MSPPREGTVHKIRLLDSEWAWVNEEAERLGVTAPEVVRRAVREMRRKEEDAAITLRAEAWKTWAALYAIDRVYPFNKSHPWPWQPRDLLEEYRSNPSINTEAARQALDAALVLLTRHGLPDLAVRDTPGHPMSLCLARGPGGEEVVCFLRKGHNGDHATAHGVVQGAPQGVMRW